MTFATTLCKNSGMYEPKRAVLACPTIGTKSPQAFAICRRPSDSSNRKQQ